MAITVQGIGDAPIASEVDGTTFRAMLVTMRPIEYGAFGAHRLGAITGTIGASAASGAEFFQFRWDRHDTFALVNFVGVSAAANVAATVGTVYTHLKLTHARRWYVAGSSGTRLTITGSNTELRKHQDGGSSLANDIGISTTVSLTPGTKNLDTTDLGSTVLAATLAAITTSMTLPLIKPKDGVLYSAAKNMGMPLILSPNEGFVIRLGTTPMQASMTWNMAVQCAWTTVAEF